MHEFFAGKTERDPNVHLTCPNQVGDETFERSRREIKAAFSDERNLCRNVSKKETINLMAQEYDVFHHVSDGNLRHSRRELAVSTVRDSRLSRPSLDPCCHIDMSVAQRMKPDYDY